MPHTATSVLEEALPAVDSSAARHLGKNLLVAVLYYGSARWGMWMAFGPDAATALWPPAGLALAALLVLGGRVWPGLLLGVVLSIGWRDGVLSLVEYGGGVGAVFGAVVGAQLLDRLNFDRALERHHDVSCLIGVGVFISILSSSGAVLGGLAASALTGQSISPSQWRWATSDLLGILVVAPLVLTWIADVPQGRRHRIRLLTFAAYLVVLLVACKLMLATARTSGIAHYVGPSMVFPLLIWAALQFGQREAVLSGVVISVIAIWGAIHEPGLIRHVAASDGLIMTDVFVGGVILTALLLGAITAERRKAEEQFRDLLEHTPDPLMVIDSKRRIRMVNEQLEESLGYPRTELLGQGIDALFRDGLGPLPATWGRTTSGSADPKSLKIEQWLQRRDGNWFPVEVTLSPLNTREGTLITAAIRDITDRHEAQQHLRHAYDELEHRVTERTAELARRNEEKAILLKEIHHRIKNNLQIICSLMNLQARGLDDPRLAHAFSDSQHRVQSMALVHEHLYRSRDLDRILMRPYIQALAVGVAQAQAAEDRVRIEVEAGEIMLPIDLAVPCGLIINELVTNAFKHAFPGNRSGTLRITLRESAAGELELLVSDDGVGMTAGVTELPRSSFGMKLVSMLAAQLAARFEVLPTAGSTFLLAFALQDASPEHVRVAVARG